MIKLEFDALTRYEVNMLIATKIMGYGVVPSSVEDAPDMGGAPAGTIRFDEDPFEGPMDPDASFVEKGMRGSIIHFDPYSSLDDCWEAEEAWLEGKLGATVVSKSAYYIGLLTGVLSRRGKLPPSTGEFDWPVTHADAITRCEALLLAIGEPKL